MILSDRWFISYKCIKHTMIEEVSTEQRETYGDTITDVSPAHWILESQYAEGGKRVILYAEKISQSLAVELAHGGVGVPTEYFNS